MPVALSQVALQNRKQSGVARSHNHSTGSRDTGEAYAMPLARVKFLCFSITNTEDLAVFLVGCVELGRFRLSNLISHTK